MTLRTSIFLFALLLPVASCSIEDPVVDPGSIDPGAGGKADSFNPPFGGTIFWDFATDVAFRDISTGKLVFATYLPFELSGPATVTFETEYHATEVDAWNDLNKSIDTLLYVYREPEQGSWGPNLGKNDDGGEAKMSRLSLDLEDGRYRLVVVRRYEPEPFPAGYEPIVEVASNCVGDGCEPPLPDPRICASDTDWNCVIGEAVFLGGGPDERVAHEVELSAIAPGPVKAVQAAMTEIDEREFEGTDYSASVFGVYEVYRSAMDHTILGYAVLGYGAGEPDYSDGILYGIALDGSDVFYLEENW